MSIDGIPPFENGGRMIRVLVAESVRILRDTLTAVLNLQEGIEVVAEAATGDAIVPTAVRHRPDVAVINIDLPVLDGLTAACRLREHLPGCRSLILTCPGAPGNLRRALAGGASGLLLMDSPVEHLFHAVKQVAAGGRVVDQELALAALETAPSPLSPRETEILRLYSTGVDPAEIAARLSLSCGTVRNYLASAVTKLSARNRIHAIRIALDAAWI
jgi:two-component system response regulator DesR